VAARIMEDPQATWSDRVVVCGRDVTERHAAQLKLRDMASQWAAAQQRERRRIAMGLHDDLGQLLALAKMKLDAMERGFEGAGSIRAVGELLADAIDRTRRLTFELCPPALYELGLEAALDALVSRLDADSEASINFSYCCDARLLHDDLSVLLYGVARELLANALRHAAAQRIDLALESNAQVIRMDVRDDGVGMGSTGVKDLVMGGGFGLFSIREQLKPFDGELRLVPTASGSHVQVTVPHGGRAP